MTLLILQLCLALALSASAKGGSYEDELTFTQRELQALPKLKNLVFPKIPAHSYINNYKNDDLYWVRWLRAKNGNLNQAAQLFTDHLKWRDAEKVDTIHQETDWSDMEEWIPSYSDGVSKSGQPVTESWFSEWQVRRASLAGKTKRVLRWTARLFELENRRLYDYRAKGKKIAQAVMLVETEGFSVITNACPSCLPVYVSIVSLLENHFPSIYESINYLNMPASFDIIIRLIKPIMRASTRKSIKVYPTRDMWEPVLNAQIDPDQRSVRFGGTVIRP